MNANLISVEQGDTEGGNTGGHLEHCEGELVGQ